MIKFKPHNILSLAEVRKDQRGGSFDLTLPPRIVLKGIDELFYDKNG